MLLLVAWLASKYLLDVVTMVSWSFSQVVTPGAETLEVAILATTMQGLGTMEVSFTLPFLPFTLI